MSAFRCAADHQMSYILVGVCTQEAAIISGLFRQNHLATVTRMS